MSPHRRKIFIDMVVVGCFDFLEKIKLSGISVRVGCVGDVVDIQYIPRKYRNSATTDCVAAFPRG